MKNILTLACLLVTSLVLAQSKNQSDFQIDERLYAVYEASYLNKLKSENPFLLKRWSFYLDNSYVISDYVAGKNNESYPEVDIKDMSNINILLLEKEQNLKKKWQAKSIYKIKGTRKLLVYYPGRVFNEELKKQLEK